MKLELQNQGKVQRTGRLSISERQTAVLDDVQSVGIR